MVLILLLTLACAGCAPSHSTIADTPTLTPKVTTPAPAAAVEATVEPTAGPTAVATEVWATYHQSEAGYQVEYPASWSVAESTGANGESVTTFTIPGGGEGIVVSVQNSETAGEDIPDLPNTRCEKVTINGLSGRRCFDAIALSTTTTLFSDGKQYTLASFGKHLDQAVYQRFSESFTVTP
jgi:hypothetical protein